MCNGSVAKPFATRDCLHVRCDRLDAAVSEAVLNVLDPAQMKLAVAALEELQSRDEAVLRQWQMLWNGRNTRRRSPSGAIRSRSFEQLVASTLERRWNESLLALEETQKTIQSLEQKEARAVTAEQKAQNWLSRRIFRACGTRRARAARSQAHAATTDQRHSRLNESIGHTRRSCIFVGTVCLYEFNVDLPLPPASECVIRKPLSSAYASWHLIYTTSRSPHNSIAKDDVAPKVSATTSAS